MVGPPTLRRNSASSKRSGEGQDEDISQSDLRARVDPSQLEEIRKGIIMPGLGGNRGNTEPKPQLKSSSSDHSTPVISQGKDKSSSTSATATLGTQSNTNAGNPAVLASMRGLSSGADVGGIPPSRSRAQPTLKASMLKKRMAPPSGVVKSGNVTSGKVSSGPKIGQGTPARATRYSLPVRADKPVRTSKTTGKHVVLPSESQLAPLPGEEDDEEEEDDDDDDDESSSEEESDVDLASRADDELADDLDEEEREKAKEAARKRREEALARAEQAKKEKAERKLARKPKSVAGQGASEQASAKVRSAYPGMRGPAHARAPPRVPKASGPVYHTFERLAPSARLHTPLPRLTSYAIGPSIHLPTLIGFLRREHGVRPRLYDECAYVVYFKPLLPGFGRAEVRSAPEPRYGSPGAESRREREIVEREESGYVGSYFVANNKDDEDDAIDEQGYIMGGEGRGQEEEEEEQAERRWKQQESNGRGDVTETETEREGESRTRKGHGGENGNRSEAEYSETEPESERIIPRVNEELEEETPMLKTSYDQLTTEEEEDIESGAKTPRALQPQDNIEAVQEAITELQEEEALEQEKTEISNADRAGARDLYDQQQRIEAGDVESSIMPVMRFADIDREDEERNAGGRGRDTNEVGEYNNGHRHRNNQHHRGEEESRSSHRKRRTRKRVREMGPNMASHNHDCSTNMLTSRSLMEALQTAELVILPYGVLVMYNMSASEERSVINDVVSSGCLRGGPSLGAEGEETEAFHFCYDPSVPAPRIFNDFFTFRASNHLLKLSLAHAIAQSTKLSVFEESMQQTLELTSHIPKELASSGELKLKRREALRLTGRLFKLRVDVNLTSNVLDTPELFWSEASLKALYDAIREYLEIDQRVENLNERLAVGNDLLEVIHDHLGSQSMNQITWIIIILIVVACFVACGEILARLVLHSRSQSVEYIMRKFSSEQLIEAASMFMISSSTGQDDAVQNTMGQLLLN
ncbi:hypothetical protein L7F22_053925 [Adiantum nelumboides]|nr:hypothetical protein [Adiantum nelumboides]